MSQSTENEQASKMIHLGARFSSYADFEKSLKICKENKFVEFSIIDSKTLSSLKIKYPSRKLVSVPDKLKYYYLKYACTHGGHHKKKKNMFGPTNYIVSTFYYFSCNKNLIFHKLN